MCEQCSAETILYVGPNEEPVLPGYALVRATKDGWMLEDGDWGLVKMNDPAYWWSVTPVEDPWFEMTEEEMDKQPDKDPLYDAFEKASEDMTNALNGRTARMLEPDIMSYPRFEDAVELQAAAVSVGYDKEKHGQFAFWLCHHIAIFLKTAVVHKEE